MTGPRGECMILWMAAAGPQCPRRQKRPRVQHTLSPPAMQIFVKTLTVRERNEERKMEKCREGERGSKSLPEINDSSECDEFAAVSRPHFHSVACHSNICSLVGLMMYVVVVVCIRHLPSMYTRIGVIRICCSCSIHVLK